MSSRPPHTPGAILRARFRTLLLKAPREAPDALVFVFVMALAVLLLYGYLAVKGF